jgi:nitroreductase
VADHGWRFTLSDQTGIDSPRFAAVAAIIRERRSNPNADSERPIPREVVDELLALGVEGPNHYRTNPYRFVVLSGPARARIGEVAAQATARKGGDNVEALVERQRGQFLRASTVIVVAAAADEDPVKHFENRYAAVGGAYAITLGATAAGIASYWRSGLAMIDPPVSAAVKEAIGLAPTDEIVAFLNLGYPAGQPGAREYPTPTVRYLDS